jgi:diguanylate cyclase (GGDEF)-like protein
MSNDKLRDEKGRLAALNRYGVMDTPREEAFDQIVSLAQQAVGAPMVAIALVGPRSLSFKASIGMEDADTSREESFDTVAISSRQALVVPDAENDGRFAESPNVLGKPYMRSYIGVPLQTPDGYNIGTLAAMDVVRRTFTDTQVAMLEKLASLVMDHIELRQIARPDVLTGALSRRSFQREVEREFFRCARYGRPASVVILDIDGFKAINDSHGHEVGDQLLQAVGRTSLGTLRLSDAFGRLGGEEFGLLLPETGPDDAIICAERLRAMIEKIEIRHEGNKVTATASFGVAALTPDLASAARWTGVAEVALYQAKRAGKNRVVSLDMATPLSGNASPVTSAEPRAPRVH